MWDKIKTLFAQGNSLMRLIYINIGLFVVIKLMIMVLILFNIKGSYLVTFIELPSNINTLLYQPWSVITYMFVHLSFGHIFFNMIALYWFGRIALEYFSEKQLVGLYILGGIGGAALYLTAYNLFPYFENQVYNSYLIGASGAVLAICVAIATIAPNYQLRMMLIGNVKLIWLATGMVVISFLGITGDNAGGEFAHLGGAILGYFYALSWKKGKDWSTPVTKVINWFSNLSKARPKVSTKKPRNFKRGKSDAEYNRERKKNSESIDTILDKIKRSGYDSLSKEEKQKLFDKSKNA